MIDLGHCIAEQAVARMAGAINRAARRGDAGGKQLAAVIKRPRQVVGISGSQTSQGDQTTAPPVRGPA